MAKLILAALQVDADIANALDPPTPGVPTGNAPANLPSGVANGLIAIGGVATGYSYHRLAPVITFGTGAQTDVALVISDRAEAQVNVPANVLWLTAPQQAEVPTLKTKLSAAVIVVGSAIASKP